MQTRQKKLLWIKGKGGNAGFCTHENSGNQQPVVTNLTSSSRKKESMEPQLTMEKMEKTQVERQYTTTKSVAALVSN